jgi:hypothetical protein
MSGMRPVRFRASNGSRVDRGWGSPSVVGASGSLEGERTNAGVRRLNTHLRERRQAPAILRLGGRTVRRGASDRTPKTSILGTPDRPAPAAPRPPGPAADHPCAALFVGDARNDPTFGHSGESRNPGGVSAAPGFLVSLSLARNDSSSPVISSPVIPAEGEAEEPEPRRGVCDSWVPGLALARQE